MTRARALKQVIRARAAKTGERYTTARRHTLRELNAPVGPVAPVARVAPAIVAPGNGRGTAPVVAHAEDRVAAAIIINRERIAM